MVAPYTWWLLMSTSLHYLLFQLRNSACSYNKHCEAWGLEGSFDKKSTRNLSIAHFVIYFLDRKSWFDSPLPTPLCAKSTFQPGLRADLQEPQKGSSLITGTESTAGIARQRDGWTFFTGNLLYRKQFLCQFYSEKYGFLQASKKIIILYQW